MIQKPFYEADGITLFCGDALFLLGCLDASLMLTDPPYGIRLANGDVDGHRSDRDFSIHGDESSVMGQTVLDYAAANDLPTIVFASPWKPWNGDWRNLIVWDKGGAVGGGGDIKTCLKRSWELIQVARNKPLNGQREESVVRFPMIPADTAQHIAAKPVGLICWLLKQFARRGDIILDPFAGSGTTLVAAKLQGHRAIGIEINEDYCRIAVERLRQGVLLTA